MNSTLVPLKKFKISTWKEKSRDRLPAKLYNGLLDIHGRKFRNGLEGYANPDCVSATILSICTNVSSIIMRDTVAQDSHLCAFQMMETPEYPWYWLTDDLARDLTLTDVPIEIPRDFLLPPSAIFMLPKKATIPSDTGSLAYVAYAIVPENKTFSGSIGNSRYTIEALPNKSIAWFGFEHEGAMLAGRCGLIPTEAGYRLDTGKSFNNGSDFSDRDIANITKPLALVISAVFYAENFPAEEVSQARGFGNSAKKEKRRKLTPLLLGKEYTSNSSDSNGGTHSSPQTHWRRGHWRRVPCGKGRSQRVWRLIKPTLVNAKNDDSEADV